MRTPLVQIAGPTDGWVLEGIARRLAAKLPYAAFVPWKPQTAGGEGIVYYVNYALYQGPSGRIDGGFFTHRDDGQQFLERARQLDFCVCMARQYADWLQGQGVRAVSHIPMGFDWYRFRPRLVLGVVGRLDHPRKGKALVERVLQLPFVEVLTSDGKMSEDQLRGLYERLDYVLIPATVEGGPMSLLEGLGLGKPVIAPEGVGMVDEFGTTEQIRRYPAGDVEALVALVTACYQEKLKRTRLVGDRTWDRWAEGHHQLFQEVLRGRGVALPEPGPAFRFGMMGEMDIPPGIDSAPLEAAVDRAAGYLYFGEERRARAVLEGLVTEYPCVRKLLEADREYRELQNGVESRRADWQFVLPAGRIGNSSSSQSTIRLSLIVSVLDSHEIVRRQLFYLGRFLPAECELIVVDDGSVPSLEATCAAVRTPFPVVLHCTKDRRPWTQPRARNIGACLARASKLLFFDIDHIITEALVRTALAYPGDKLHWVRKPGILDEEGMLVTDHAVLVRYGLTDQAPGVHGNSFLIQRGVFQRLGGYDERFCGKYGGDDIDFNRRYDDLCRQGLARLAEVRDEGYYFPDPGLVPELFHSLRRVPQESVAAGL
jgi:hypothetical protein